MIKTFKEKDKIQLLAIRERQKRKERQKKRAIARRRKMQRRRSVL